MTNFVFAWESNPAALAPYIRLYGIRRAYFNLRALGGSRYQTIRAILLSI
jgi:hypothetical protein